MTIPRSFQVASLLLLFAGSFPDIAGAFEFQVLHTIENIRGDQSNAHASPITSDDSGTIYYAFMDSSNKILIGRKPVGQPESRISETPLYGGTDQYHHTPSIGIDPLGRVHVFGPMHWRDMDYRISILPFSVSSFTRFDPEPVGLNTGGGQGGYPNFNGTTDAITYAYVTYDNDFNIWVSYRARVGNGYGNFGGVESGNFGKYNTTLGKWQMLGGNSNPNYAPAGGVDPKPDAFIWSEHHGSTSGSYQSHTAKPFIDASGRIHFAFKHDRDTAAGGWSQDVLYFYSDDNGNTWKTADGATVADSPITIIGTPSDVMTPNVPSGTNSISEAWSASSLGRPVVAWSDRSAGNNTYFAVFENGQWNISKPSQFSTFNRLLIDTNNVWYILNGQYIYSSTNNGNSWKTYNSGISSANALNQSVDIRYFKKTNKIRYVAMPSGTSTKTVQIVEFVSDEWAPPDGSPPPAPPEPPELEVL